MPAISATRARRLALAAQGLDGSFGPPHGPNGTAAICQRLGYVPSTRLPSSPAPTITSCGAASVARWRLTLTISWQSIGVCSRGGAKSALEILLDSGELMIDKRQG